MGCYNGFILLQTIYLMTEHQKIEKNDLILDTHFIKYTWQELYVSSAFRYVWWWYAGVMCKQKNDLRP